MQRLKFYINEYKDPEGALVGATAFTDLEDRRIHYSDSTRLEAIQGLCRRLDELEVDYEVWKYQVSEKQSGLLPPEGQDGD